MLDESEMLEADELIRKVRNELRRHLSRMYFKK